MKKEYIAKYFVVYNNGDLGALSVEKTRILNTMATEGWVLENYNEFTEAMPEDFTYEDTPVRFKTILDTLWSKVIEEPKPVKKASAKKTK